jgi:hypothetical protein
MIGPVDGTGGGEGLSPDLEDALADAADSVDELVDVLERSGHDDLSLAMLRAVSAQSLIREVERTLGLAGGNDRDGDGDGD